MSNFDPNYDPSETNRAEEEPTEALDQTNPVEGQDPTTTQPQTTVNPYSNPYQDLYGNMNPSGGNPYSAQNPQNPYQNPYSNPYQGSYQGQAPYQNPYNPYPQQIQQPTPPRKKGITLRGTIALILVCAILFGCLGYGGAEFVRSLSQRSSSSTQTQPSDQGQGSAPSQRGNETTPSTPDTSSLPSGGSDSLLTIEEVAPMTLTVAPSDEDTLTIPQVVEKTADSVVEITTEIVATSPFMQQYITSGAGSGVIIAENGYILTNNHVISDATSITVTLHNGESYPAALVGLDEDLDVALLKIEETGLTPAVIGTSSNLLVGQTIIVIGNPLGQLGGSVTHGIISALERNITIDGTTMTLMQIDAAVNPGNSGGALFDESGDLVGIVNAKSGGDNVEGIGFAIPIDNVMEIVDDLLNYGYVKGRPALGITMIDITTSQMAYMYQVGELGAYIYSVAEGSAAEQAGLQNGDRIVSINGTPVSNASEVKTQVGTVAVGETVTIVVSRNGQEVKVTVTMGEYIPNGIKGRITTGSLN